MMNALFRMLENFDSKFANAPLSQSYSTTDRGEFGLRFTDASLAADDALTGELLEKTPLEKDDSDTPSLDPSIPYGPVADYQAPEAVPFRAGENAFSAPLVSGEKVTDKRTLRADSKVLENESLRAGIMSRPSERILSAAQGNGQNLTAIVGPRQAENDQAVAKASPQFRNNILADYKSSSSSGLVILVGDKSEMKLKAQDGASLQAFRAVAPVNPTLSTMASLPLLDIASTAPMSGNANTTSAPSLPTLNTMINDQWVAQLGREIGKLTGDKTALSFQLKPQNLGKLHVEIISGAAGDIVRVDTDNEIAKQLILGAQMRLEQDIRLGGSKLVRVDVTHQEQLGSQQGSSDPNTQGRESATQRQNYGSPDSYPAEPLPPTMTELDGASSRLGTRYA